MRTPYWLAVGLTIAAALGSLMWESVPRQDRAPQRRDPRVLASDAVDPTVTYSNILPGDYVGPETCAGCHEEQYRLWKTHPHHCMNQIPSAESVLGDFNEARLKLPTGEVVFTTGADGNYFMTVATNGSTLRRYQVTRTVGSRYMQAYIGKQIEGPEPEGHDIYREHRLPFAYWFKIRRWVPREYLNIHGPETLKDGIPQTEAIDVAPEIQSYGAVCMNCHNTYPYAYRIFHSSIVGFPDATVAAAIGPLSQALAPSVQVAPDIKSFVKLNERLDPEKDLVTQGISCESCHFGGREHALYEREIRFLPTSQYTRLLSKSPHKSFTNDRSNAATINGVCTQCHSGDGQLFPTGAGKSNSREALDLHGGFCASEMRCVDCHEPHTGTQQPSGFVDQPKHIQTCTNCHSQYSDDEQARTHSRHSAGANVNCLDCHMPRYTRGIDELIRSHRICMPVEQPMVEQGMPNACNTCHLDKSVRWTLDELKHGWGKTIAPQPDWPALDQLDQPAGAAWLNSNDSHMRLLATQSFARSPLGPKHLPALIQALNDPERINRVFAEFAVARLLNRPLDEPLPVDVTAPPAQRQQQIDALLEQINRRDP